MPHLGANNRNYVYVSSWFSRSPQLKPERINGNAERSFVEELLGLVNPQGITGGKSSTNSVCAQLMWDEDEQWKFLMSQASTCTAVIYFAWKLYETPPNLYQDFLSWFVKPKQCPSCAQSVSAAPPKYYPYSAFRDRSANSWLVRKLPSVLSNYFARLVLALG